MPIAGRVQRTPVAIAASPARRSAVDPIANRGARSSPDPRRSGRLAARRASDRFARRARPPSIRPGTSCSRPRPAPARRACWSIATSICCAPASIPTTSSPSRSPKGRRRDARAHHRAAARREPAVAADRRRAGAISRIVSATSRSRPSTRSVSSLLREFPLEADVDPAFELADETEVPRLVGEALDRAFRICRAMAKDDDDVALVFAQLGERRLRIGIAALLDRRLVAPQALRRFLARGPRDLTAATACRQAADAAARGAVAGAWRAGAFPRRRSAGGIRSSRCSRPTSRVLARRRRRAAVSTPAPGRAAFRELVDRLRGYFLTQDGKPRDKAFAGTGYKGGHCDSDDAWRRHRQAAAAIAPAIAEALRGFRRDLNVMLSRGVWRMFAVALRSTRARSRRASLLDFSGVLERAVKLLEGDGRVRAQPVPARVPVPPRARRRIPGHQPRAVGAGRAAGAQLG